MGKRSNFAREGNDYYRTFDDRAAMALLPHVEKGATFLEPCAGAGDLVDNLERNTTLECLGASDVDPQPRTDSMKKPILQRSALDIWNTQADYIITNPPWSRGQLHSLIFHFKNIQTTWLLFDANWIFTQQSTQWLKYCSDIVACGRLRWIPDTDHDGKDDAAWYRFQRKPVKQTIFHPRIKQEE